MSLGRALVDALKGGAVGSVEAEVEGVRAVAEVVGSGPYGAELRGLTIQRAAGDEPRGPAMERVVSGIAERVQYLPERLAPLELDPASGRGILRTRRDQVQQREYYEVLVDGGERVDVGRFRYDPEAGARRPVGDNLGHRVIERLVDDLGSLLGGDGE